IKVESPGLKRGNYANIYINGKQASLNKRGYNIVVVNPYTSDIERSASFDTCGSFNASKQMKEFINSIPEGRIVAVAVKDDASSSLTKEAALSLRNLGATGDLSDRNKHFRWSHAIIGMKGLKPGEALESYGLGPTAVSLPFSLPVVYRIDNDADDMVKSPEVKIIKWSPHKITIETDSKRDGFLVLSEIFYPGWKVYIDGKKGEILRANGIFRAVYVERGQHLVQFTFLPFSFELGLYISMLTLLIGLIICYRKTL
ncbi:MAG: YfhO family protein, partial [Candidatus Desulfofervidus auxilii]|nr:YfhO family protein [Candidatus Desulfofervidus auxilii]